MPVKRNYSAPCSKVFYFSALFALYVCTGNAQQNVSKVFFPQVFFDSADAAKRLQEGNSTISGVAFARVYREGSFLAASKHYAVNETVVLFPYTEYFAEWYNLKYDNPKANIVMTQQAFAQRLETKTDQYGNFTFTKMKPGKYYLECSIDYVGTASSVAEVGTRTVYWGWSSYSTPLYQKYYYNFDASQRANKIVEVKKDGQLIEVKLKPNPFENFKSGKPVSTDCYQVNNKQFGECKEFFANGKLSLFAEWKNGWLDGHCDYYYENGVKKAAGEYKKGFKTGNWKYYDSSAVQNAEENYVYRDKMSVKEGLFKYCYKSGKIKSTYNYKDDKIIGDSYDYFESGNLKAKYFYINGLAEGDASLYYESGNLKAKLVYKNDKLEGTAVYYTEKGTVEKTAAYKNGVLLAEKK